ncbi:MAG TPA: 3-hydroxyacyl-CoA dehydrogenase NAD-binding domain-containing protein [Flavisolibacter sp.]|jgi:3-hydroxybutyryl-CoA dehydrogenase|nr:3-hydroxyacyl-CoA dehydrogenase NAD-binding domain-containing protein [Flavisolibacter sp.]
MQRINSIIVCGAGTMGSGIAQVSAMAGFPTVLYEPNESVLQKAGEKIKTTLQTLADRGKITPEKQEETLQLFQFTSALKDCTGDAVIEAIIEKPEAKIALFNQLAQWNDPETLFLSNTSSLSISEMARHISGPHRVAGLHFFNPAPVMKLVEVVQAEQTAETVVECLLQLVQRFGKTPVLCKDAPGFIVNRVARPYYIEALRLLEEGVADVETIDRLLESKGFKMGPFRLMDLIGNDINYAVSCSVYEQLQQPERLKPSSIQQEKVEKGELGKKSGKGYYRY